MKNRSVVGDLINFRGLVYSPMNENGVIFLFGKVVEDLNMYIEEIKTGFPDCIGRRFSGKGWEKVAIEFEYKSSEFKRHNHNPDECDIIVCWEHDWPDCPIEVLELREIIKSLPNKPVQRPDRAISQQDIPPIEELLKKFPSKVVDLFKKLDEMIKGIDDNIWRKTTERPTATYYSPERVFVYCNFQKQGLRLAIFTRGEKIQGVSKFPYEKGGAKWGLIYIRNENDLNKSINPIKKSYQLIKEAIKKNEPTGWYSEIESDEETDLE